MKHYFLIAKSVGGLTRYFLAAVRSKQMHRSLFKMPKLSLLKSDVEGFRSEGGQPDRRRAPAGSRSIRSICLRIFAVAQKQEMGIHPVAMTWLTQSARHVDADAHRSRCEPDLSRHPDRTKTRSSTLRAHERGRRARPLHPGFRPGRGADAVRHVSPVHGR